MRIMLLTLAGAVSALAVASPAAAQWAPQPSPYGYGGQGYGYGYNNYGASNLQQRIANIRRQVFMLSREQRLSPDQSRRLFSETRELDARVRQASYSGMNPYEMRELQVRVARLEQQVRYAASYGSRYGHGAYGNSYGYNGYDASNGYYGRGDREGDDHDRWGGDDRDDDGD